MNRTEEYNALLSELEQTPPALEYTVTRAKAKAKTSRRVRRFVTIPVSSIAAFLVVFVVMVNSSLTIAVACGRIPLLRDLAAAVAFSPSLSAAVKNEYVQPIEQEQTINGITMRIEYVIVDQKQLNIFYSLDSQDYSQMDGSPYIRNLDGSLVEGFSISSYGYNVENGDLRYFSLDFSEDNMPEGLILGCNVHDNGASFDAEPVPVGSEEDEFSSPEPISTFEFTLQFDPERTAKGEIITLNQSFVLDGQRLIAEAVEIYPTHIRFNIAADEGNTAWITGLSFYLENEKGERFDTIGNGISASGSTDSPMMKTFRLESAFFSQSKKLTLVITGIKWLDKDMERVKVDLANVTAELLPEGVEFKKAVRSENDWYLVFATTEYEENHMYETFGHEYYDEQGNEYLIREWSSHGGYYNEETKTFEEGVFTEEIPLKNYPHDIVYLSPLYSRTVTLDTPVELKVK